jgi:hypothetical protein
MPDLIVINIPGDIGPMDRGDRYEDPLNKALKAAKVGKVTGGGTSFTATDGITSCDIELDIPAKSVERAIPVIRDALKAAKAPVGTTVMHLATDTTLLKFGRGKITETPPGPRKKRFKDKCTWTDGTVFALELAPQKHVLLHFLAWNAPMGPVFRVANWIGATVPDAKSITAIFKEPAAKYFLQQPYNPFRLEATDRDESKFIDTTVILPVLPKHAKMAREMMGVPMAHWPLFEDLLRKCFGLAKCERGERLMMDYGFGEETQYLCAWHPDESPTIAETRDLFDAYASMTFRKTHPGRTPMPVTKSLAAFVTELKAAFHSKSVFPGAFDAKEGFVLIGVYTEDMAAVRKAAKRIAEAHGVCLYDSDADRLIIKS